MEAEVVWTNSLDNNTTATPLTYKNEDAVETVPHDLLLNALKTENKPEFKPESFLKDFLEAYETIPAPSTADEAAGVPDPSDPMPTTPSIIATVRELTEVVEFSPSNLFYHVKGGGKDAGIFRVTVNGSSK